MMRVAYLTDLMNATGGGASNADRLCQEFHNKDEIDLVAVHAGGTGLPENLWSSHAEYLTLYPKSLRDGLEEVDADLIFVHSFNADMFDWLGDYADEHPQTILVYRAGVNTFEQWVTLQQHRSVERVTTPIAGFDCFDAVFAPSHAAAERIKMNYGNDSPHLAVAPCTITYNEYSPTPFMEEGSLRVVTATRIAPNNYALAPILAVRRLVDEYDMEMEILSAGEGPYLRAIHAITEDVDEVEIVGHIDYDDVQRHLEWADVVCIPTASQQAVPTVAVEAMAAGNVVLCAPFYTGNEENTLVRVPLDHPPAWYDALSDVAEDADGANDRIRRGLRAARNYDTATIVDEAYMPMFELLRAKREMDE